MPDEAPLISEFSQGDLAAVIGGAIFRGARGGAALLPSDLEAMPRDLRAGLYDAASSAMRYFAERLSAGGAAVELVPVPEEAGPLQ
jgi:hypothetical protein